MEVAGSIEKISDLLSLLDDWKGKPSIFRGVVSKDYKLVPSIGRCPLVGQSTRAQMERRLFKRFKERSLPHLGFVPRDDWEWLAVAQHYGLPTRLLDWSSNPLAAAYFAVETEASEDSAIFLWATKEVVDKAKHASPFATDKVLKLNPPAISERIVQQTGLFTVHPEPEKPLDLPEIQKHVIPKQCRREIKRTLFKLGFSRAALFPGLDGIAADLAWEETGIY
jgi:FRG domain